MRKAICALSAAVVLSGCVASGKTVSTVSPIDFRTKHGHSRSYFYSAQTDRVEAGCMPMRLLAVLGYIRSRTGVRPVLTSGKRHGGRRGSMHHHCMAADIRVAGFPDRQVVEIARSAPGIGGIGVYCNGIVHVDVGQRREWTHCGRTSRRK